MNQAKALGVRTRKESIKADGTKHRTWRLSADVAAECTSKWEQRFRASAASPSPEDAVGNSRAASSSVDPGGNHSGQEGLTRSIHEHCPLRHVPHSIATLNVHDLRKACQRAGVATKSVVNSADGSKHRVHVSKEMLQRQLVAKQTVQEAAPASAEAPESSCVSDYDKTVCRQDRTLPCSSGSGFAMSVSSGWAKTSGGQAPLLPCDAPSGSGFVMSAPPASGKDTPADHISLRTHELRRECQRAGIATTLSQHSKDGRKRHVYLRTEDLTRKLAAHRSVDRKKSLHRFSPRSHGQRHRSLLDLRQSQALPRRVVARLRLRQSQALPRREAV